MYLKSIKAYGFKSFADKTEINFEKNINGIVGPNGSGKSNVVDAVRWVLGEQSIKSLRGDTSTDIIFSGSKSRKALNSASVTLVFDNSDFYLPVEYTEVSVKRIMYRSGENEYYLNNEKCRLKDITNLLTDTGADKESFNIISQGKIDEILSTKPGDRRAVFESAAGVMKYKKRKEEAVKKLERTNLNINRVNDILNELEKNLSTLERQSKDATKYLEVKDILSNLSISLMTSDITKLSYETKTLEDDINNLNDEIVSLSNTHSSYDIDILSKKDKVKELEVSLNEERTTLIELTKSIEKINADIKLLRLRKEYTSDIDKEEENLLKLKEDVLILENNYKKDKNELEDLSNLSREYLSKEEEIRLKYDNYIVCKNNILKNIDNCNRDINNLEYKINYLESNIENNNSIPSSVKNILNHNRLTGSHHIVGKLITMDNTYTNAINISLGASINYLVVDTTSDAKKMVRYLQENKLGRATFLPIDTIKPRYIDSVTLNNLKRYDGFIDIASNLVKYDSIYQNIINNLLGNIIITKDINTAVELSRSILNRYKIVTLDGQVINVGGSITGGSIKKNSNIIEEQYELEKLKLELITKNKRQVELKSKLEENNTSLELTEKLLMETRTKKNTVDEEIKNKKESLSNNSNLIEDKKREIKNIEVINKDSGDTELEKMLKMYYSAINSKEKLEIKINNLINSKKELESSIEEIESLSRQDNSLINQKEKRLKELEIKRNTTNIKLDNLLIALGDEYNITYEAATSKYKLDMEEEVARERVKELKNEIKEIGSVNIESIEEYKNVKTRYDFLSSQREDLKKAEETLLEIMQEMDEIMKDKFVKTFECIRVEFKKVFREMFKGGEAELVLTEPDNLLETGIEIQAIPSGKNLKSISLLSGGEKTFTAISLLFAILNVRPVPFCLLDEVEAALDDANVESFGHYLDKYRDKTQFILITHKKKTMEFANTLYGITMQESGVSKLVSVRLDEIENKK